MPTYPFDTITGGYLGVSCRLVRSAYAGNCFTIQRTDGTSTPIGFDATTKLVDMAIVASFLGISNTIKAFQDAFSVGNVARVTTWNDQSGGGRNLTSPTSVYPVLLLDFTGLPVVRIGPGGRLINAFTAQAQPYSMATTGRCWAPGMFAGGLTDIYAGMTATTMAPYSLYGGTTQVGQTTTPAILGARHSGVGVFNGANCYFNYDGSQFGPSSGGTSAATGLQLNALSNARSSFTEIQEFLMWTTGTALTTTQQAVLVADMMAAWPSVTMDYPAGAGFVTVDQNGGFNG